MIGDHGTLVGKLLGKEHAYTRYLIPKRHHTRSVGSWLIAPSTIKLLHYIAVECFPVKYIFLLTVIYMSTLLLVYDSESCIWAC